MDSRQWDMPPPMPKKGSVNVQCSNSNDRITSRSLNNCRPLPNGRYIVPYNTSSTKSEQIVPPAQTMIEPAISSTWVFPSSDTSHYYKRPAPPRNIPKSENSMPPPPYPVLIKSGKRKLHCQRFPPSTANLCNTNTSAIFMVEPSSKANQDCSNRRRDNDGIMKDNKGISQNNPNLDDDRPSAYSSLGWKNNSNTDRDHNAQKQDWNNRKRDGDRNMKDNREISQNNGTFQPYIDHDRPSVYSSQARRNDSSAEGYHDTKKTLPVSKSTDHLDSKISTSGAYYGGQQQAYSGSPTIAGSKRPRDQQRNQYTGQGCHTKTERDVTRYKYKQEGQALRTTTKDVALKSKHQMDIAVPISANLENHLVKRDESTHVIFCIDCSGSMKIKDVKTSNRDHGNNFIARWDAVFNCACDFVSEQAKIDTKHKIGLKFSLIIFNEESKVVFERIPLCCQRDEGDIKERLKSVCSTLSPCKGTLFSPAFKCCREVASGSAGPVMIIFLSDGRPADLPQKPNFTGLLEYKYYGKKLPSANVHIEHLQKEHGDSLSLQFVCIYNQGRPWLEKLASEFDGTFHMSNLDVSAIEPESITNETWKPVNEEVEIIGQKSAETQKRDKYNLAIAAGNVIELTSSMRNTFRSISTTLSSIRTTTGRPQERGVVLESVSGHQSAKIKFDATRMILHQTDPRFVVPDNETVNGRIVSISTQPFAQGGLRNVYHITEILKSGSVRNNENFVANGKNFVAKESRHIVPYNQRLAFHRETVKCQVRASQLARRFNKFVKKKGEMIPRINFLKAEVYRLKDSGSPGGHRYLAVEKSLVGKTYLKYNSNNGYVMKPKQGYTAEDIKSIDVAQAFSHFTFEESAQQEMVVDIQGIFCAISGCTYTDPQLHSKSSKYGRADRGIIGISDFFESHVCGSCCSTLGLPERKKLCL